MFRNRITIVWIALATAAAGVVTSRTSYAQSGVEPAPPPDGGHPEPPDPELPRNEAPAPEPSSPLLRPNDIGDPLAKTLLGDERPDPLGDALAPDANGLTPQQVASKAVATSPTVARLQADVRAATARVEQALAAYFPTATLTASYTRQSPIENSFDLGFEIPGGLEIPSFPVIENVYTLTASLDVPLSDYLLRLTQAYATVTLEQDAKTLQATAQSLQVEANAKMAYLAWVRAQGHSAVAALSQAQSKQHLSDAKLTLRAGLIAKADVLRLEAQLAQAQHLGRATRHVVALTKEQLRNLMHLDDDPPLTIGIDVMGDAPPLPDRRLPDMQQAAITQRLELQALDKARASLDELASATRASYWPRVGAFANGLYANPNPRIFPQNEQWDFTWELGLRMTWTVNDSFRTIGRNRELEAQSAALSAERRALEDGIRMAVAQAHFEALTAHSAIDAAKKREQAAVAGTAARRKLFLGGKATATDMVDAEAELTAARLQRVDAHIDLLNALVKLDHAMGTRAR